MPVTIKSSDQISLVDLTDGYSVNLSTDAFTFAGDTTKVKSTQSFSTTVYGYCGSSHAAATVNLTTLRQNLPSGMSVSSDGDAVSPTLTFTATTDLTMAVLTAHGGMIDIPVSLSGGEITLHKNVAISIALTGATGEQGVAGTSPYSILIGNEAQVIACDKDGNTLSAGTITIPYSIFQGTTRKACSVSYSSVSPFTVNSSQSHTGTDSQEGLLVLNVAASSSLGGTDNGSITLTFNQGSTAIGTKTFTWSKSIAGQTGQQGPQGNPGTNGTSATNVVCGNEAVSIPCTHDGLVKSAITITIPFAGYIGTARAACSLADPTLPSGMTKTSNTSATTSADGSFVIAVAANGTLGNAATMTGEITLTFTCNSQTFVKKFTWSKAMTGATGEQGPQGETGADGNDAITMVILSSAGTIFKNSAIATTLTAHVYKGGVEVTGQALTALGTIRWYKDGSSEVEGTGVSLTITAQQVTNRATYVAQLES